MLYMNETLLLHIFVLYLILFSDHDPMSQYQLLVQENKTILKKHVNVGKKIHSLVFALRKTYTKIFFSVICDIYYVYNNEIQSTHCISTDTDLKEQIVY